MKFFTLIVFVLSFYACSGVDLKQYEALKDPNISTKEPAKMLVIQITGDPEKTAGQGYSRLYRMNYKLPDNDIESHRQLPRARWPKPFETPREEYIGIYAVPVSNKISALPEGVDNPEPKVKLENWEYGEVAEILHIGSYEKEAPTIDRLKKFILDKGYEISGVHEEEYLKGPGMFFKGNEDEYVTIIRYPVKPMKGTKKK